MGTPHAPGPGCVSHAGQPREIPERQQNLFVAPARVEAARRAQAYKPGCVSPCRRRHMTGTQPVTARRLRRHNVIPCRAARPASYVKHSHPPLPGVQSGCSFPCPPRRVYLSAWLEFVCEVESTRRLRLSLPVCRSNSRCGRNMSVELGVRSSRVSPCRKE